MDNYINLIDFLQKSTNQGFMKFHTARTRKTAIKQVFEGSSYTKISVLDLDVDKVVSDYIERLANPITEDTIKTYKSRIKRSIDDYIRIELLCPLRKGEFKVDIKNIPVDISDEEIDTIIEMIKIATK